MTLRFLIAEDEGDMAALLERIVTSQWQGEAYRAANGKEAPSSG
jgi:hypothetical protein